MCVGFYIHSWLEFKMNLLVVEGDKKIPLFRKTPSKGGRQQPHQTLEKFKKYKGGKKHHTMVAHSAPKMPKWHHSTLKA
jgi:hypothetical protein